MIMDLDPIYRKRKEVRFYDFDSKSEWSKVGRLIGLNDEVLSEPLADRILLLSQYLQEVQQYIWREIHYQNNEIFIGNHERKSYNQKGFTEDKDNPGYWKKNGYSVKGNTDSGIKEGLKETELPEEGKENIET